MAPTAEPIVDPKAAAAIVAADQIASATKADTEKAAADTAAAEKTAADKAAADAAAAGKTPEPLAAEKAAADKEPARKDADASAKPPEKYELTLPTDSPLDLATITTEAQALGLTNDQAQKLATARHAAVTQAIAQIHQDYADVQADPVLGGAHFDTTVKHVHTAMTYLFGDDVATAQDVFARFGLANNKVLVRGLQKLGKNLAEDTPIKPGRADGPAKRPPEDVLYGKPSA